MKIKNLPKEIYLVLGEPEECEELDFNELSEITWCEDKVFKHDVKYGLVEQWHDLRKHPKDLPPYQHSVYVKLSNGHYTMTHRTEKDYSKDRYNFLHTTFICDAVAWIELPKFKEK